MGPRSDMTGLQMGHEVGAPSSTRGAGHMNVKAEIAKESASLGMPEFACEAPETREGLGAEPPAPPEGAGPAGAMSSGCRPPELGREVFVLFRALML